MSRYSRYGQTEDAPMEVGDSALLGVNAFDSPENLQPGQVQAATNIDFTTGDAATRGGFVCLPELGAAPFGMVWTSRTPAANLEWSGIAYGNGIWVATAVTGTGNRVMTSPDGITWTSRTSASDDNWIDVCFGGGLFVAVCNSGTTQRVMTSANGITWALQTTPNKSLSGVAYGNGQFVAVGSPGVVITSPDGTNWTLQTTVGTNTFRAIAYGNGLYVAVAVSGGKLSYSTDAASWTTVTDAAFPVWLDVTYGNGLFAAVGTTGGLGRIWTSPNGATWTQRNATSTNGWYSVAYGDNVFVSVANSGSTGQVMTSENGIGWVQREASAAVAWVAVGFGNGTFVAVATNAVMTTNTTLQQVFGTGLYSDPNATDDLWTVLAGSTKAGFYAFGKSSHTVSYPAGVTITKQSTVVQANNLLFIFPGTGQTPIQWNGNWNSAFTVVAASTLGTGFESIPESNHAIYNQNRLWVVNGKDRVAASDVLDFEEFDTIANDFNLNTGSADYVVCTYPFGDNSIVVFKHTSSILLENVQGSLSDVTTTEISRNLGLSGINAVTLVGPDLVYVSDRNITSIRLNIQNKLQNVTEPLSRNINPILKRVNWTYGSKISVGYWNNLLYVAVPLDSATTCSTVLVYNFITGQWYGEWTFAAEINMAIIGWVVGNYLGQIRMHAITEDGRIFVTDNGQNDISGTTVAEISTSLTTRAYVAGTGIHAPARMFIDLSTNRPNFTVTAYSDGANESTVELSAQTFSRADSWLWSDSTYNLNNSSDDYNRAYRKDYSTGPDSIQCGTGFSPEMTQDYRLPLITRRHGRLSWFKVANTTGYLRLNTIGMDARESDRSDRIHV